MGHKNLNGWDTIRLWVAAGGRCEICRNLLTESSNSFYPINLGERAHIVGQGKKTSPRHDPELSEKLANKLSNVMLLCLACHTEIDKNKTSEKYPVETLRALKEEHEERVRYLTSLAATRTQVFVFRTAIQQNSCESGAEPIHQTVTLHRDDLYDAILPEHFPKTDEPLRLDVDLPTREDLQHWSQLKNVIRQKWQRYADEPFEHLSIFCLGKIPAIAYFGRMVGNTRKVRIMNVQNSIPVRWQADKDEDSACKYICPDLPLGQRLKADNVALTISLSGQIEEAQYINVLPPNCPVYSIGNPPDLQHPNWLTSERQVEQFGICYQSFLSGIQQIYGMRTKVHLFMAAPTPIVFEVGKLYRPNQHPEVLMYNCVQKQFEYALSLSEEQ